MLVVNDEVENHVLTEAISMYLFPATESICDQPDSGHPVSWP
jgi:hypothetical protein